ncbi:uncharacterized protein [Blastocystis hominis]|uniref:Uncharacterized protein n=1 Tax=Blastocystis hominis TaxID=12968 RepID=D8M2C2_BLAHO|nr:uncharacterized protein [Blastocystis hominis]CBK22217.2 unnamed protein product [Blastocystis hominis]|eukprot:XP_012896265.1 uncharacterized protein [Blastocystis hominis]
MFQTIAVLVILSIVSANSSVTITEFNPANATVVSGISFPVILTFSENIQMGEGSIIFRNDFGDIEKVASNSTGFVLGEKNVTVTPGFELIYGSSYSIYFEDTPVLDMSGEPVSLLEGVYMFTIAKKDNGPMLIGIGIVNRVFFVLFLRERRRRPKRWPRLSRRLRRKLVKIKFSLLLVFTLLLLGVVAEQEQMFEVTVDNSEPDIVVEEGVTGEIEDVEMDIVDEIIDCDVLFENGTCKENFKCFSDVGVTYFEQFLSCDTLDCIRSKKKLLEERLLIGDPNAQFTYYIFTKYGFFGFPKDIYLATTHLHFSAESHSVAGSLSLATRLQTGDRQPVNLTRALEIAIPAWHSITSPHSSLFDALYLPSETDWPKDLVEEEYDVSDYVDVLRSQLSREKFRQIKRRVYLSKKSRDLGALLDLYRDVGFGGHIFN